YPLEQIWHPRVSIVNETNSVSRKLPESVEVESDGRVTYRQRYVGAFTQPLRLQSFPFDRQTFRVQLVAVRYQSNEVMFVPDQVWIQDGLKGLAGSRHLLPCQIGPEKNGKRSRSCTRWRRAISIRVAPLNSRPRAM